MTIEREQGLVGELIESFEYLDDLRESGRTNMWGASAYLRAELGKSKEDAAHHLRLWMETFDGESSASARAAIALASSDGKETNS